VATVALEPELHWAHNLARGFHLVKEQPRDQHADCVSFALMHELGILDSFTTGHYFRQAGFNPLLERRK
jgi:hypothetical protein